MTSTDRPGTGPPLDFADWYAREFPRLRSTLALVTGDVGVAEEATAEAFARALVHWPRLSRTGAPNGWVYTVALNQVRSGWRRLATERRWLARQRAGHVAPRRSPIPGSGTPSPGSAREPARLSRCVTSPTCRRPRSPRR
jgi:DNA-directed RNA polymerase specialized sigma24 family protein